MNVVRKAMTLAEFLEWEEQQELRYEYDGFAPVAMVGGTWAHSTIQANLIYSLTGRLRGAPCRVHGSHLKIQVMGHIRYPDAFVVCKRLANDTKIVHDPVVLFEILSPNTAHTDLVLKNAEYCGTPSVKRHVVLEQNHIGATMFTREADTWSEEKRYPGDTLEMPEIGISIPLAEFYIGLDFETESARDG